MLNYIKNLIITILMVMRKVRVINKVAHIVNGDVVLYGSKYKYNVTNILDTTNMLRYISCNSKFVLNRYQCLYDYLCLLRQRKFIYTNLYLGITYNGIPRFFISNRKIISNIKRFKKVYRIKVNKNTIDSVIKLVENMYKSMYDLHNLNIKSCLMDDLECDLSAETIDISAGNNTFKIKLRNLTKEVSSIDIESIETDDLFVIYNISIDNRDYFKIVNINNFDFSFGYRHIICTGEQMIENIIPPTIFFIPVAS